MKPRWSLFIAGILIGIVVYGLYAYRNRPRRLVPLGPSEIALFVDREVEAEDVKRLYTGAKFEPEYGCYLGACIDLDPNLPLHQDGTGRQRRLPQDFEERVGKHHASYMIYQLYGARTFPTRWVRELGRAGKIVQIALEPNRGLEGVKDDEYLEKLAGQLASTEAPILLRFASEMNGPWTNYHGDPKLYIEKWRLVTSVMRKKAPNVAMVWCPYTTPRSLIDRYYPGDEWVDWVGVNMYSVTYYNQDRRFPGLDDHPADLLSYVYEKYSARKPIAICEYAAASYSAMEDANVPVFAEECIRSLYWALPRRYPRVKFISYFSSNNMQVEHRKNNDYSVLAQPEVIEGYREAIAPNYFLSSFQEQAKSGPMPLRDEEALAKDDRISVWARSPGRRSLVEVLMGEKLIYAHRGADGHSFAWPGGAGAVRATADGKASQTLQVRQRDKLDTERRATQ